MRGKGDKWMRKKKLIVALIISILCCSLFTSVCLAQENAQKVQDEQEIEMAKKGIESYIAWYTINHGGYDFYMNRFKNPTTTVAERNQNDPEYSASMLLWRVATFQFEKEAEYATSEIGYYETFLFNMLYNDENESFLNEFSDQYSSNIKIFQTVEKALGISAISSVCKAYKELGEEWGLPQNTEDIEKFKKSLQEADNIKDALDIVGDVTDYIGYFKTANDLVNSLARLQSILNASTKEGEILEELSGKSNNNTPMQLALKEYSTYTKEAMSPEEADAIMTGTVVGSEALKEVCKNVFDKTLLAAGGYGFTVMNTGQKVGKFVANTAFNTEAVIAAEYKIDAVYNLNELLREQLKSYEKTFISNPTEKNAQKFNIALKMFYKLQLETMDCYKEFVDAVYNKGLGLNFFRKDLTKEKYQEIIDDISSIKKYISQTMESDRELAVDLYTEILPEINTDLEEDQIPEKLTPVLTDEEKTQTFNNIEYEIMPYSTGVIESDLTLSDDMEVYGDVYLKKGTLNLNGYNLTVNGNLYQEGGSLLVKKGTLEVEGNYYIANISESEAGEEEYGSSQGTLKMMYGEDKVVIHGDFMTKSSYSHSTYLTAGTMYVSGDFRQCIGVSVNFDSSDQHKVVLNGTEPQKIEIDDPNSGFATLDIENSNPITVKGYLRADILETELNKINIESDGMRLVQTTMSDDVEINGDVYLGYSGAVNLKGHKLTVYGNIYHDKRELIIAKGTLEVNGNYYIASISENEAGEEEYGSSQGILKMMYGEDRVIVHGDFLTKSNYSHSTYLTAGTMYVSGDFRQCIGVSVNFDSSDQHKVVLNGTEPQKIEIDDPNSGFATLDIENSNPITVKGYLRADILETELNKINIESDGMRLVQTTMSDDVEINGDVYLGYSGAVNLKGHKLTVYGNIYHDKRELIIAKGTLEVNGNYYIASISENEAGEEEYGSSQGILKMMYGEDRVIVHGDFLTKSNYSHSTYLTAGTMYVSGDFRQCIGVSVNFDSSDQHKVVLNGTEPQKIEIDDPNSGFATLDIENSNPITVKGYLRADILETELNKINIESDGMRLVQTTMSDDVEINGDVYLGYSGAVNLKGHKLTVYGNIYHDKRELIIAKGTLEVNGNYYIASISENEAGEEEYGSSKGTLKMTYGEDKVVIRGDFMTKSSYSHSTYLTAGTMYVSGDFRQCIGTANNFNSSDQHKVVLNGIKPQKIVFESYDQSHFNILQLTQDKSQYTFNPEPCWNEIQENVKVEPEFDNTLLGYGVCGDDVKWTVNNQGVLHIYGIGVTYDYDPQGKDNVVHTPWEDYNNKIVEVVLDEGITRLGNYLLVGLRNVEQIDIPKTVVSLGNYVFASSGITNQIIPDTVKEIGNGLFARCGQLVDVSFPSAITEIPDYTFNFCLSLTHYIVPKQITKIGKHAFEACLNLQTVDLPEGLEIIEEYAFNTKDSSSSLTEDEWNSRKELASISLPSTLTTIGDFAFRGCCFEEVVIPDNVANYGYGIFEYCEKLKKVTLPKKLEVLSGGFEGCTSLEEIYIPETVIEIGNFAFRYSALKSVKLPEGLERIGMSAFFGCNNMEKIVIPKTVTNIDSGAFCGCENLKTITFCGDAPVEIDCVMGDPRNHTLKNEAYYPANNSTWTEETMKKMGPDATWIPYGMEEVIANGTCGENLKWQLTSEGILNISGTGTMKNYSYKSEMPWFKYLDKINSVVVEEGVTSLGDYAFYGMTNMEEIQLPEGLETIGGYTFKNSQKLNKIELPSTLTKLGESAFYGCTNLTAISIPEGLYTIWAYTFKNCTNLAEVTLPSTLIKIDEAAFYGCSSLKELSIPDSVSIIGIYCFKNCSSLISVDLPAQLTQIREAAFYGTGLTDLEIPEGVTKIDSYAFKNASSITTLSLPESLTKIGEAAFYNSAVHELIIPDSVETIGSYAFKNCISLRNVQLPKGLKQINESSFYGCTSLESLVLPENVTSIGSYAFRKCSSLKNVEFSVDLTTIGESAFYGCERMEELYIPEGVTTIEGYAFKSCVALKEISLPETLENVGESVFHSCVGLSEIVIPASVREIGNYAFSNCVNLDKVYFSGDAPVIGSKAFSKVNILAIYPADNSSWTEEMMQNYGGNIEWIPSDKVLSIEEETYSETVDSAEAGSSEETESDIQEEILEETESIQEEDVLYEEESESEEEIMNTEETENLEKISEILS